MHSPKRQGRGRTRILYCYRTPPGVRVGRSALDEDAIKLIEESHPQIRFNWAQILKGDEELPAPDGRSIRPPERQDDRTAPPDFQSQEPMSAALRRLGAEGLARLRARYANVLSNIDRRISEPERREQLKSEAERLNPDSWVTDDEVRVGLEQYEAVFDALRNSVGRRRRRRRKGSSAGAPPEDREDALVDSQTAEVQGEVPDSGAAADEGDDDRGVFGPESQD